ncbi:MAG TPA: NUDIX domain-containing protein [Mycobacteriales bacterium]
MPADGPGPEPPRPWRLSSRLLVVHDERVLMLRAYDPRDTSVGHWWEIPGGGVEPGEDTRSAAVRETAEETGYVVPAPSVGPACWHGETTYLWLGRRHWAEMVVHVACLTEAPPRREPAWQPDEQLSFLEVRWVPVEDVLARRGTYFPDSLPADLPRLLAGERIDAGFTVWS